MPKDQSVEVDHFKTLYQNERSTNIMLMGALQEISIYLTERHLKANEQTIELTEPEIKIANILFHYKLL